ncbi:MAG: hypothetical protein WD670_00360, partial [Actinomycetota bacterium]
MTRRNTLRAHGLLYTLSFALAACSITIGERREDTGGVSPVSPTPPVEDSAIPSIAAPGRLAVVGVDGRLTTMQP